MEEENKLNMNINISELEDVVCEKCENPTFINVVLLKRLPATLSPTGKKVSYLCLHLNVVFVGLLMMN